MKELVLLNPVKRRRKSRVRRNPLKKGSAAARRFMASIRKMKHGRKRTGSIPRPPMTQPPPRLRANPARRRKAVRPPPLPTLSRQSSKLTAFQRAMLAPSNTTTLMAKSRKRRKTTSRRKTRKLSSKRRVITLKRTSARSKRLHKAFRVNIRHPLTVKTNPFHLPSVFSQTNLGIAGGVISGTVLTDIALSKYGSMLPGVTNAYVLAAYRLAIPLAGAYGTKMVLKNSLGQALSLGFVIAGIVNGARSLIDLATTTVPTVTTPTAAYLGEYLSPRPGMSAYLGNRPSGPRAVGEMPKVVRDLPVAMNGAFPNDAWGN